MEYYIGATVFFDPTPSGSLYAQSGDRSIQIWEAESYDNDMVNVLTKAEADAIKARPGWEEA